MQSISHWGQFEMQAAGTDNFRERLGPGWAVTMSEEALMVALQKPDGVIEVRRNHRPTSFFVSRQDKPEDPENHPFY